jgi:hypothetical protein
VASPSGDRDVAPQSCPTHGLPLVLFPVVYKLNKLGGRIDQHHGNRIMKASLLRKADRVAKDRAPEPRTQYFWWDLDETWEQLLARIRAKIASGEASETDGCVTFTWTRPQGSGPGD